MANQLDIISVGDIVTDDFIELLENEEHTYSNEKGKWLAIPFGTKIPFNRHEVVSAVGNASNAAVCLTRLGLNSAFATDIGGDQIGRDMLSVLAEEKVDHRFVRIHPKYKSNYHFVLRYGAERTILIKHEEYDYHWPHFRKDEIPRWIYLTNVSKGALDYHKSIAAWLDENPEVKLAFQPGTFQMEAHAEHLRRLYEKTEVLILNREEAVIVGGGNHADMHDLINKLHDLGPRIVVVTDGSAGAYVSDGNQRLKMPIYPDPAPPVDRTGAGDAFASTFVAALAKGHDLESALQMAPINSMSVCQKVGAQAGLLTEAELEAWLAKAPDWYHADKF